MLLSGGHIYMPEFFRHVLKWRLFGFLSTPSMQLEPFVDHRLSQQFGLFAVTVYHFAGALNVLRMNGYDPLVPFDPGADRVSYSLVFHSDMIALSLELGNAQIGGDV